MRRQGPVRRRLRKLRHDQRAHRSDRSRTRRSPARGRSAAVGASLLPAVRPACRRASCKQWTQQASRLQPEVFNKTQEWLGEGGKGARRLGHLARRAVFRHSDSGCAAGKYFYVWLDAPIGYLASLKAHLARSAQSTSRTFLQDPRTSSSIHFIGKDIVYFHTLFWPAMLKFAGPVQGAGQCVRARLPHRVGREDVEVARHRHQPRRLPRPRPQSGVAALLHRREAQRQGRGHRLQSRRLHRARQQRPRSASTSTSPAARRTFLTQAFRRQAVAFARPTDRR